MRIVITNNRTGHIRQQHFTAAEMAMLAGRVGWSVTTTESALNRGVRIRLPQNSYQMVGGTPWAKSDVRNRWRCDMAHAMKGE